MIATGGYHRVCQGGRARRTGQHRKDNHLHDEFTITEALRKKVRIPAGSALVRGIGDDCAIYRPRGSADDLLFTTDMVIENVHFRTETHKAAEVGRKALARGLSDIAAMGGAPRFCLVSLCAGEGSTPKWVDGFFDGVLALGEETGTILAGGDLSRGARVACDVVVCGAVPRGEALLRSGAGGGHEIWVSGELGGSALGLETGKGKAKKRHVRPEPRLALGQYVREKLRATAAMDISDGLSLDLRRMCLASNVSAVISAPPRFAGASVEQALHGGEDYELLFTVRPGTRVPERFGGLRLTRIGQMLNGAAGEVLFEGKRLEAKGWDHFASQLA